MFDNKSIFSFLELIWEVRSVDCLVFLAAGLELIFLPGVSKEPSEKVLGGVAFFTEKYISDWGLAVGLYMDSAKCG